LSPAHEEQRSRHTRKRVTTGLLLWRREEDDEAAPPTMATQHIEEKGRRLLHCEKEEGGGEVAVRRRFCANPRKMGMRRVHRVGAEGKLGKREMAGGSTADAWGRGWAVALGGWLLLGRSWAAAGPATGKAR
jgi:hypothetical protein